MKCGACSILAATLLLMIGSCGLVDLQGMRGVETSMAFFNLSKRYYAAFQVREHSNGDTSTAFSEAPLLPPGGTYRSELVTLVGSECSVSLDFRIVLYRRVNEGRDPPIPIGLDDGEAIDATPIVTGQIQDVPGPCAVSPSLGIYTVVNWEADDGQARVKFAQGSQVESAIIQSKRFPNPDAAWELEGVDSGLPILSPPPLAPQAPIAGRVIRPNGMGVEGIGVILRSKFRVRLSDENPQNDPDAGYSDPIAFVITDETGSFSFQRPPGTYQVELFSNDYAFGPRTVEIESPLDMITILADPIE